MSIKRFLANLFSSSEVDRRPKPEDPVTSEDYAREIETEKERRRGMRGDAGM